jgi:hypothetical protein
LIGFLAGPADLEEALGINLEAEGVDLEAFPPLLFAFLSLIWKPIFEVLGNEFSPVSLQTLV